jgi:hypothetical protein
LAQVNAYESLFQSLTQKKPGLQEDFVEMALMIIIKRKNSIDYTCRKSLPSKPSKKWYK